MARRRPDDLETAADRPRRRRHGRDAGRRRRGEPRHGRALDAGRVAALRHRRRRLVPGRPADRRRPRPDRAHRRRARARRAVRRRRLCAAAVTRRPPVRPHRGPRRAVDLVVATWSRASPPKRGRGRPPKVPRTVAAAGTGGRINPWDGVWRAVGWLPDGAWVAAIGESETAPQDLWLLPVPGVAPEGARPRQVTDSMPAVLARGVRRRAASRPASGSPSRPATGCASRARSGGRRRRPASAAAARPDDPLSARRADLAGLPLVPAVQAAARGRGVRVPRRRLPRFDRLRPGVPPRQRRRVGPRRHARHDRRRALGRRAAVVRRPARDLRRLVRRLPGPVRARRGARAVARRRRPVRRLGDRRELPPRRPAGPAGPAPDDGRARRSGTRADSTAAARRSTAPSGSRRRC